MPRQTNEFPYSPAAAGFAPEAHKSDSLQQATGNCQGKGIETQSIHTGVR